MRSLGLRDFPEQTTHTAAVPLVVTAWLQQGAVLQPRMGIALDGLLAAAIRENEKHGVGDALPGSLLDGGANAACPRDVGLPLTRCHPPAAADQDLWHWSATTAVPINADGSRAYGDPDVHYRHVRADQHLAGRVADRIPATLSDSSGRYRAQRLPTPVTVCAGLAWRGVGDPDQILALLSILPGVGAARASGEGAVLKWEVHTVQDGDVEAFGHLHADGSLGRAVPESCLPRVPSVSVVDVVAGFAGLRPPYWHPARRRHLITPRPLKESA